MLVPKRELSLGEILDLDRRANNFKGAKKSTTHYKKVGNLWYVLDIRK